MAIAPALRKILDGEDVEYEVVHHRPDTWALRTAVDTDTPPEAFAKSVVVCIDGRFAVALLPATHYLVPSRLARATGATSVRLATESEMRERMPGFEVGAAPPFPALCGLPIYASPLLARDERITFNAGTHRDALRMRWSDYERLAKPEMAHLSHHEEEETGASS